MPECPEVTLLSDYLKDNLMGKSISTITINSGKYLNKTLHGKEILNGTKKYSVTNVESKGKVLYITLKHLTTYIYFVSHLGMSGEWSFQDNDNNERVNLTIHDKDNNFIKLYYYDPRNFGNIEILNKEEFKKRLNKLAPDVLKTEFTNNEFVEMVKKFLNKSKKRGQQLIFKVLTKQNLSDGIFSGLGNYLIPEILYDAKISPYRQMSTLSDQDLEKLAYSIKYITKLSYYNNITGYMTNFGDYSAEHKKGVDNGIYKNYHEDVQLKKTDTFKFKIYLKKKDPLGNEVEKDKLLNKGRTTHWVKNVQI
jgi:DNA-formamidopyrimidine glycosylase